VPTANREVYKKHAEAAAVVFEEHGALKFVECWGDDVPEGKVTSFPMAVKRKDDETVVFSWIIWPSRNVRDEGMKKVMADPRLKPDVNPMPFDGVLGVEGDFAGTTIKDSVNAAVVGPGAVITGNAEASLDWVSTLAPRVGYAFNNWLVYGKV